MELDNGIEVEGLVREYRKGPRAVDGIDLAVRLPAHAGPPKPDGNRGRAAAAVSTTHYQQVPGARTSFVANTSKDAVVARRTVFRWHVRIPKTY